MIDPLNMYFFVFLSFYILIYLEPLRRKGSSDVNRLHLVYVFPKTEKLIHMAPDPFVI